MGRYKSLYAFKNAVVLSSIRIFDRNLSHVGFDIHWDIATFSAQCRSPTKLSRSSKSNFAGGSTR